MELVEVELLKLLTTPRPASVELVEVGEADALAFLSDDYGVEPCPDEGVDDEGLHFKFFSLYSVVEQSRTKVSISLWMNVSSASTAS